MGVKRRNSKRKVRTVSDLVDRLPDRLLDLDPEVREGDPVGLKHYIRELSEFINDQLGVTELTRSRGENPGQRVAPEVMRVIGADAAQWYRVMLSG